MSDGKTLFSMIGEFFKAGCEAFNSAMQTNQQLMNGYSFTYRAFIGLSVAKDFGEALDLFDRLEAEMDQMKKEGLLAANYDIPYDFVDLGMYTDDWAEGQKEFARLAERYFSVAHPSHLFSNDL